LIQAGETWRLEMAPLGVRVITLVTGGIATNFFVNLQTLTFPENSYYKNVKDIIEDYPDENPYGMKPELFAQDVLQQVEKGATGKHWVGGGASIVRFALWLLPQGAIVSIPLGHEQFNSILRLTVVVITGPTCVEPEKVFQEIGTRAFKDILN
jgi:hypothetical protein